MYSVLIVSGNERAAASVGQLLCEENLTIADTAPDAAQALRKFRETGYDIVIINAPLPDSTGELLARTMLEESSAQVMLIVRSKMEAAIEKSLGSAGAFVVAKPLNRTVFVKGLHFMQAALARTGKVQSENAKLQRKLDEGRIIDRAKGILIKYLSMTEPQAHRYLEKQAMDLRLTKLEVAKNLLSTYDS